MFFYSAVNPTGQEISEAEDLGERCYCVRRQKDIAMHVLEGESMQLLIFNHMFSSIVFVRIQNAFFHTYTKRKEKKRVGKGRRKESKIYLLIDCYLSVVVALQQLSYYFWRASSQGQKQNKLEVLIKPKHHHCEVYVSSNFLNNNINKEQCSPSDLRQDYTIPGTYLNLFLPYSVSQK